MTPRELYDLSDEQLLEKSAGAQTGSAMAYAVEREFQRRALIAAVDASRAQIEAAKSAADTSRWTKHSAIAIAASVVVMAIGEVLQVIK